jgi:tripartite-type tricarboxylate transporter receptor subunit TctC
MKESRFFFAFAVQLLFLLLVLRSPNSVLASSHEGFPNQSISWIVPYAPGGGFDLHSRAAARGVSRQLGVSVIVKNMPGAGGVIGWNNLYAAKPDGHTIGMVSLPGAIVSELFGKPKPQYRLRELSWISRITDGPYLYAVKADSPYRSLEDMQRAPEILVTGTGVGATAWVVETLTSQTMKFNSRMILGFKNAPEAISAILRGEGEARAFGMDSPGQMQFIRDGHMRPLWVYAKERDPDFPNVPTVAELGYPELAVLAVHRVMAAPPGVPRERLAILHNAFAKALAQESVQQDFNRMDARLAPLIGEELKPVLDGFFELIQKHSRIFTQEVK